MERMQTRERKPKKEPSSPPRVSKPKKVKPKPKPKPKPTSEKANPSEVPNESKEESNPPNMRTIQIKNDIKTAKRTKNKKKAAEKSNDEDSPSILPKDLKVYVSQDIWNSWSTIRRQSFKQIIQNPNTFFYRNRPPGDPQKQGKFTDAEERLFIKRLKYFREELGIENGYWGYFAVPILGRVGYQCSNYYRLLIESGKIIDSNYEIGSDGKLHFLGGAHSKPSEEIMKKLNDEAFAFIKKCFDDAKEDGEIPKVSKPISVTIQEQKNSKSNDSDSDKNEESDSDNDRILIEISHSSSNVREKNAFKSFDSSALKNGRTRAVFLGLEDEYEAMRSRGSRKDRYRYRDTRDLISDNNNICPLVGAIDQYSKLPIEKPMMDPLGVVLDKSSWKKIFHTKDFPKFDIAAFSMNDLIELNSYNFDEFRYFISNIVC